MEDEIIIKQVTKRYEELTALRDVSLSVSRGMIFALLGPNGAGKTTLVKILTTLMKPTSGSACVGGHDVVKDGARVRSLIGVVPQENNLDRYLTARENLIFHAKMHRMNPSTYHQRIDQLLSLMGLADRQKEFPNKVSTGMQRRLVVARALVHDPRILFLDEPTTGLDPQAKRLLWDYFLSLKGKRTLFLTTHNMEEAEFLSDRITIIDHGSPIASGTSAQLKETADTAWKYEIELAHPEEYVARFQELPIVERSSIQDGQIEVLLKKGGTLGGLVESINPRDLKRISSRQPSLEDVFLKLTGRDLRQ